MLKFEMHPAFIWKFLHISGDVQCVQRILWNRSTSSTSVGRPVQPVAEQVVYPNRAKQITFFFFSFKWYADPTCRYMLIKPTIFSP